MSAPSSWWSVAPNIFAAGFYLFVAATHADLWWHRRGQPAHLWLALSAFGALVAALTWIVEQTRPELVSAPLTAVNSLGVAIAFVSLYELALAVGRRTPRTAVRVLEVAVLVSTLLFLVLPRDALMVGENVLALLFLLAAFVAALRSAASGDRESRIVAAGLAALVLVLAWDVLADAGVVPGSILVVIAGFGLLYLAAARALSLRYEREYRELENLRNALEARVRERTRELEFANRRLDLLSRTDALTGLANRRAFVEGARARLHEATGVLVMADIDHFKRINDTWGHGVGDEALQVVSAALGSVLRPHELLARWGGEEFIALLDEPDAAARVEAMRAAVAAAECRADAEAVPLSASFGLVRVARGGDLDAAIGSADAGLYEAKRSGRNRVVVTP